MSAANAPNRLESQKKGWDQVDTAKLPKRKGPGVAEESLNPTPFSGVGRKSLQRQRRGESCPEADEKKLPAWSQHATKEDRVRAGF